MLLNIKIIIIITKLVRWNQEVNDETVVSDENCILRNKSEYFLNYLFCCREVCRVKFYWNMLISTCKECNENISLERDQQVVPQFTKGTLSGWFPLTHHVIVM